MPVESLLMLPAGENTGLNWLGAFSIEGVLVALLDPADMDEPARPGGTGDSPRFWPTLETGRGRYVAAAERDCGKPGMPGDVTETDGHLISENKED